MELITDNQRRLYQVDKEALDASTLEELLKQFGIDEATEVTVNYTVFDKPSKPMESNVLIRVTSPNGTQQSLVCPVPLTDKIGSRIKASGLRLTEMDRGLHTYARLGAPG